MQSPAQSILSLMVQQVKWKSAPVLCPSPFPVSVSVPFSRNGQLESNGSERQRSFHKSIQPTAELEDSLLLLLLLHWVAKCRERFFSVCFCLSLSFYFNFYFNWNNIIPRSSHELNSKHSDNTRAVLMEFVCFGMRTRELGLVSATVAGCLSPRSLPRP